MTMTDDVTRFVEIAEALTGERIDADRIAAAIQAFTRETPAPPILKVAPWQSFKTALSKTLEEAR